MSLYIHMFPNLTPEQLAAVEKCFGDNEGYAIAWINARRPCRQRSGVYFTKGDWAALRSGTALKEKVKPRFSSVSEGPFKAQPKKKIILKKGLSISFGYGYSKKRDTLHSIFSTVTIDGYRYSIKNFENIPLVIVPDTTTFFTLRAKRGNKLVTGSVDTAYVSENLFDGLMSSLFEVLDHRKELEEKGLLGMLSKKD